MPKIYKVQVIDRGRLMDRSVSADKFEVYPGAHGCFVSLFYSPDGLVVAYADTKSVRHIGLELTGGDHAEAS